jgi:hypothetical protein
LWTKPPAQAVEDGDMPVPAWRALLDHADGEQVRLIGLGAEPRYRHAAQAGDADDLAAD